MLETTNLRGAFGGFAPKTRKGRARPPRAWRPALLALGWVLLTACSSATGAGGSDDARAEGGDLSDVDFLIDADASERSLEGLVKPDGDAAALLEADGGPDLDADGDLDGAPDGDSPEESLDVADDPGEDAPDLSPDLLPEVDADLAPELGVEAETEAIPELLAETETVLVPADEWLVNQATLGYQTSPDVAAIVGGYVIVWESAGEGTQEGQGYDVVARCVDSAGQADGPAFEISGPLPGDQQRPSVVGLPGGGFAVAWDDELIPGDADVYLRRFAGCEEPEDEAARMNSFVASWQGTPRMDASLTGELTLVWESGCMNGRCKEQDGSWVGVFARRLSAAGVLDPHEWQVNTFTIGQQMDADVVALPGGRLLLTWASLGQVGNGWDVFSQGVSSDGDFDGSETRINVETEALQSGARIALMPNGELLVTWMTREIDGGEGDVFLRRVVPGQGPLGDDIAVHPEPEGEQVSPAIAALSDGTALVVFSDDQADGDGYGLSARRFDASANPVGPVWTVNEAIVHHQHHAAVAAGPDGSALIVWQNAYWDGDGWGIVARAFSPPNE